MPYLQTAASGRTEKAVSGALVKLRPRSTLITNLRPAEPMKGAFMITDVAAVLATLGEAQQTVLMVMEATVGDSGSDSQTLADLHAYVADFALQADALLAQLLEADEDDGLTALAEALVEFFEAAETQIMARLAARSG